VDIVETNAVCNIKSSEEESSEEESSDEDEKPTKGKVI